VPATTGKGKERTASVHRKGGLFFYDEKRGKRILQKTKKKNAGTKKPNNPPKGENKCTCRKNCKGAHGF